MYSRYFLSSKNVHRINTLKDVTKDYESLIDWPSISENIVYSQFSKIYTVYICFFLSFRYRYLHTQYGTVTPPPLRKPDKHSVSQRDAKVQGQNWTLYMYT